MPTEPNRSALLSCHNCNAHGALTMAGEAFVAISGGFHIESGRTQPDSKVVVCSACDEIHSILPMPNP